MPLSAKPDDELVRLVRGGDRRAYAELWLRHSAAAHAAARSFTSLDADDLVAEAYARILAAVGRGAGPEMGFRPYLLTSVRNVAREWGARDGRVDAADLEDSDRAVAADAEDDALHALEAGATATAFRTLPTRWQEALWYAEVDGLKPRQFAPLLGLAPNAASALLVRARRGFRDAWIGTQLRRASDPECIETLSLLGSHTRGGLSRRDGRRVDAHLATCAGCALAWEEARDVASRLALVLLPLAVGVTAATGYAAWAQAGGAQAAAAAVGGGAPASGTFSRLASRPAQAAVATAAGLAVVAGSWAWAAATLGSGSESVAVAAAAPASADPAPQQDVPQLDATLQDAAPPPVAETPVRSTLTVPVTDTAAAVDTAPDPLTAPSPDPTPTPTPTPTPSPTQTPETATLPAPALTADTSLGPLVYPLLAGTGAQPGATIALADADGTVWATTTADAAGSWQVDEFSGAACATDAAAYLPAGTHSFTATQSAAGVTSPASAPVTFTVAAAPVIVSPEQGAAVSSGGFTLSVQGEADAAVQRIKLPDAAPCRPTPMTLNVDGWYSGEFTVPDTGEVTIGARYLDAGTGRHGPASFVTFIAG